MYINQIADTETRHDNETLSKQEMIQEMCAIKKPISITSQCRLIYWIYLVTNGICFYGYFKFRFHEQPLSTIIMYSALIITTSLLLSTALCSVMKRRRCVEYRKANYFVGTGHFEEMQTETEHQCMISCVRRHPCMAFNYHAVHKICILLPEVGCMAPGQGDNSGYVFVHLTTCKLQPVNTSVRPTDHHWYWSITDDPNIDFIVLTGFSTLYVSRMLYRGYYLPGW